MKRKATWGGKRNGAGAKPIGPVPCTATLAVRVPAHVLAKARKRPGLAAFIREKLRDFAGF